VTVPTVSFRMTLSDLERLSKIRCVARPLCDSWASCFNDCMPIISRTTKYDEDDDAVGSPLDRRRLLYLHTIITCSIRRIQLTQTWTITPTIPINGIFLILRKTYLLVPPPRRMLCDKVALSVTRFFLHICRPIAKVISRFHWNLSWLGLSIGRTD